MSQGYITLATGPRQYLEMAINLLLSLKHNDPKREVCLVIDEGRKLPPEYEKLVDHVAYLSPKNGFHGCLNKLRVHELSPFDETMFVDADCLLVKTMFLITGKSFTAHLEQNSVHLHIAIHPLCSYFIIHIIYRHILA